MPPRRKRKATDDTNDETDGAIMPKMAKKTKEVKGNAKKPGPWKMPPPIPSGEILTDFNKKQWMLGGSVGRGGFGEIYMATPSGKSTTDKTSQYVIKVEPYENGPLFTELSFYRRAAKAESINEWIKSKKLKYLAIPKYISSGAHTRGKVEYRFMVMERFGEDIEKLFCNAGRQFGIKTVCYLALRLLEALEYLHESEYVHADVKGSNLLIGYEPSNKHKVYLVDYGLAYRYCPDGQHKEYKPDPRRCHDGTIEFTSIDAHDGANPSRRGDLEILGYCLLQWACGRLPWEDCLEDKPKVATLKKKYKESNIKDLMKACFKAQSVPVCLQKYMEIVYKLSYEEKPKYNDLKRLFVKELSDMGMKDDEVGIDWIEEVKKVTSPRKRKRQPEAIKTKPIEVDSSPEPPQIQGISSPPKKGRVSSRNKAKIVSPVRQSSRLASKRETLSPQSPSLKTKKTVKIPPKKAISPKGKKIQPKSSPSPKKKGRVPVKKKVEKTRKRKAVAVNQVDGPIELDVSSNDVDDDRKEDDSDIIILEVQSSSDGKHKEVSGEGIPSDIISEFQETDSLCQHGKSDLNQEIGSTIIPGLQSSSNGTCSKKKELSDNASGSDIIPGIQRSNSNSKGTLVSETSSTIIPGLQSSSDSCSNKKEPSSGSDIIPGLQRTNSNSKGTPVSDQEIGSTIIPGIQSSSNGTRSKKKELSDNASGSDIIPGIQRTNSNNKGTLVSETSSTIIPGLQSSSSDSCSNKKEPSSGSDIIPGLQRTNSNSKGTPISDQETGSTRIPGHHSSSNGSYSSNKELSSGSDIIPGLQRTNSESRDTPVSNQETGSTIIPGLQSSSGSYSSNKELSSGSDIIPGLQRTNSKSRDTPVSDQETNSTIIPGLQSNNPSQGRKRKAVSGTSNQVDGSDIIPQGHYPPELGYNGETFGSLAAKKKQKKNAQDD